MVIDPQHGESVQSIPVWLAALFAAGCRATDGSRGHAVPWVSASGRAVYTNAGPTAKRIEPLGVSLEPGQTLAVWWGPGETAYSVEVYGQNKMFAREDVWAEKLHLTTSHPPMDTLRQPRNRRRPVPARVVAASRDAASAA